jgi:hypothetical protein
MNELLQNFAEAHAAGKDQLLRVVHFEAVGRDLVVRVRGEDIGEWAVTCTSVGRYVVSNAGTRGDSLELAAEHPLLWEDCAGWGRLSFHGDVGNPVRVVIELLAAHRRATRGLIPFERYWMRSQPPWELLAGRYGELAHGPLPLIEVYQQVIDRQGVTSAISPSRPAAEGHPRVLVIGATSIIAEGFAARRHAPGG